MMRNVLLTIAYDGTNFSGWQTQPGKRTVQGELERVLLHVCAQRIRLQGTSRTDAGVHAFGQCASFVGQFGIPADRIPIATNGLLPDVQIIAAEEKPEGFHARFDARGKTYLYRVACVDAACAAPLAPMFLRNHFHWLSESPNIARMAEAAAHLVGTHDFAAFQSAGGTPRETTVRTLSDIRITERSGEREISAPGFDVELTGDGFLYNMVRILVGTLIETGLSKREPTDIPAIIESKDRTRAGYTAPAQGLYLMKVYFKDAA
jgi:tRNA pseudouridine38-40 synthase